MMYDCSDSDRKVSATKKIHSRSTNKRVVYFTKSDLELESDEDVNEASMKRNFKKTANTEPALLYLPGTSESARLYISPALPSRMGKKGKVTEKAAPAKKNQFLTSFVELRKTATKIPTTSDEDTASVSFLSDEDVATVSGPSTPNWNRVKAKDSPEVFEAVVNDDDLKLMPLLEYAEEEEEDEEDEEVEEGGVIPPTEEAKSLRMKAFANMSSTSIDMLPNTFLQTN